MAVKRFCHGVDLEDGADFLISTMQFRPGAVWQQRREKNKRDPVVYEQNEECNGMHKKNYHF